MSAVGSRHHRASWPAASKHATPLAAFAPCAAVLSPMRTAQPGLCGFAFSADVAALLRCQVDKLLPEVLAQETM